MLGVDLWSVIHGVRAFLPRMLAQGGPGHVVNTASMTGLLPMPRLAAYSTAKSGVVALSESLQHDLLAEGSEIGVSVFCPGFIATRITDSARNRPQALGDTAAAAGPRTVSGVAATMTAEEGAARVVEAVRSGGVLDPHPRRLRPGDPRPRGRHRLRRAGRRCPRCSERREPAQDPARCRAQVPAAGEATQSTALPISRR